MEVSIYRLRTQDVLALCVLSLLLLGVVMVQSASAGAAMRTDWQWSASGVKDAIFAAAGLATFFLVGTFNYAWLGKIPASRWKSPILWILGLTVLANLLVLVPHVGLSVNGRGDGCHWGRCRFSRLNWRNGPWCFIWRSGWRGGR